MVVAKWEGALDLERARRVLYGGTILDEVSSEPVSSRVPLEITD
jgi:hypothetical protein